MDNRSRRKELFNKLVAIKNKVNQKFQFVPNRFEQFECIPLDPKLEEMEKQAIIDKLDEKYSEHEKRFEAAVVLYQILVCLNDYFAEFLKENQLSSISDMTDEQKQTFKGAIPAQAQTFYTKIKRAQKFLNNIRVPDISHLEQFLRENAESFADQLMTGHRLTLDDKDFQARMEMFDQLGKVRERYHKQVLANASASTLFQEGLIEKLKKLAATWNGLFLNKEFTNVGVCDEHAALSLFYIMKEALIDIYDITVEKISIRYTDKNDKEDDGHTFLAINRDPDSKLSDIASWGPDAILLDPWNKLICYASDYPTLPIHYVSFPSGAKWRVAAFFGQEDKMLAIGMTELDRDYYMTGNSELEKRIPLLMEEFQLFDPLRENPLTGEYLYDLRDAMRPADFDYRPELFLTTAGDEVFQLVPGFDVPKIAIHKDFTEFTEEELQFGMMRALVMMQHHWAGMTNALSADEQFNLNKLAIEKSQNGPAAISFLRKSEEFRKRLEDDSDKVELSVMAIRDAQSITFPDQIKALMTFFALDENHHLNTKEKEEKQTNIPEPIVEEMKKVTPHVFFAEGLAECKGKVAKLHYLTACLPDLKIELVPYELNRPSRRVRDFCSLLKSLEINLNKKKERGALNTLLNVVHAERIPGFKEIYFAAQGVAPIQPLGFFRQIQNEINKFIEAKNFETAREAALSIKKLRKEYDCHFEHHSTYARANHYTKIFEQKNQGKPPTGLDRHYCSNVGEQISWRGFVVNEGASLPWERHIEYAKNSLAIAYTLWDLDLRKYTPLWEVLPARYLLRLHKFINYPLVTISGFKAHKYGAVNYEGGLKAILAFVNAQYPLRPHMFEEKIDFRTAVKRFYYTNWRMLVYPQISDGVNYDNAAVKCLLDKFNQVVLTGSAADKQVIKDFFTAPKTQLGLRQLQVFEGISSSTYLSVNSPYILFLLQGKLFTPEELAALFFNDEGRRYVKYTKFPIAIYQKLYDLPETITIDCLEKMYQIIEKQQYRIDVFYVFWNEYYKNNSPAAFSTDILRLIAIVKQVGDILVYLQYSKVQWHLPWDMADLNISLKELIYLYRYYDNVFQFPSERFKHVIGAMIFKEIMLIQDAKTQIERLEELLLQNEFSLPLTDMRLRNRAINQWVKSVSAHYGKDNGLADYQEKLLPILKRVISGAANRDIFILMEKLSVTIEAQWGVSEFIGERLESEKFFKLQTKQEMDGVTQLSKASKYFSDSPEDQKHFLDFISAPLTKESLQVFETYITTHKSVNDFIRKVDPTFKIPISDEGLRMVLCNSHFVFWERTLEQRAVIIEYVIIPSKKVLSDELIRASYQQGFDYIAKKLLPHATDPQSDDHFAYALIEAYLNTADKYVRGILLAGMLVATNEVSQTNEEVSIGKKIALLCEHMGPAYIKLAQAVHSHPGTPEYIRRDLDHVKGRANPPYRWQLWRLANEVLPKEQFESIKRVGRLLGSASYNLAMEVELSLPSPRELSLPSSRELSLSSSRELSLSSPRAPTLLSSRAQARDPNHAVLLLLRENAKHDAAKGFKHLEATVRTCQHPRMLTSQDAALSIIDEARALSLIEMSKRKSEQQYAIAAELYKNIERVSEPFIITMAPVQLHTNGHGFRFIERVYGEEFNHLPASTPEEKSARQAIAEFVLEVELVNILSGSYFDSDRHGNQLRAAIEMSAKKIHLGLYDFGEMALEKPTDIEIKQLADLIDGILPQVAIGQMFNAVMVEKLLAEAISKAKDNHESSHYLMRVRKALLALQDFIKEIPNEKMLVLIKNAMKNDKVHLHIRQAMLKVEAEFTKHYNYYVGSYYAHSAFNGVLNFFQRSVRIPASAGIVKQPGKK